MGAVNTVQMGQSLTRDTARGLSQSLWGDARLANYKEDPSIGFFFGDDFLRSPDHGSTSGGTVTAGYDGWSAFLSQGGAIANPTGGELGGAVVLSSDGDDEGVVLASKLGSVLISTKGGSGLKKCWFEVRLKSSTVSDTKHDIFAGLVEGITPTATVPITATGGTLADKNLIGFHRLATDGDQVDFVYKADGQAVQYPTGLTDMLTTTNTVAGALAADTYVKLGFKYDQTAVPAERIKVYVNGMPVATFITETMIAATTFPSDMALGLALAVLNATGSSPGTATFEWIWVAGEYL